MARNSWQRDSCLRRQLLLNLTSFLFKILHNILPIVDGVSRIFPVQGGHWIESIETFQHAVFECERSSETSQALVEGLTLILPTITPKIIKLDFECAEDLTFPLTWIISYFLWSLWEPRTARNNIQLTKIRSDLEASCRLLRESRLNQTINALHIIFPDLLN